VPGTNPASESQAIGVALKKLRQQHDARGALEALDRYRTSFPNGRLQAEAGIIRVEALLVLSDRAAALRLLDDDAMIGQGPRSRELLVLRGELRASANRCVEAVGDLGRGLSAAPHDAVDERALFARASCLSRLHRFQAARGDLEQYQAHFPNGTYAALAANLLQSLK
jgi:Flp pilus assembly protein TadD